MPIEVTCGSCSSKLRAPDTAAGKKIKCPKCAAAITVPVADNGAAGQAAPESPQEIIQAPRPSAPPRRREEEEERPTRHRDRDDFDDDLPRRRGTRRDGQEAPPSTGLQVGLGAAGLAFGIVGLIFAFVPCCGLWVALPLCGLGALLGGIGTIIALMNEKRGLVLPLIGAVVSVLGIGVALVWYLVAFSLFFGAANKAANQAQKNLEAQKKQQDLQKKQDAEKFDTKGVDPKDPRAAEWKTQSRNNLKKLVLAMHNYHDMYRSLPAQTGSLPPMAGKTRKAFLSWRVALLPLLDQSALYDKFKHEEPWDSPHNKKVLDDNPMPGVFASPAGGGDKRTHYQIIVGPKAVWTSNFAGPQLAQILDGTSNTVLIAEAKTPVYWTQPEDVQFNDKEVPPLGGIFADGFNAAIADGSVAFFQRSKFQDAQLLAWITASGGEAITEEPDFGR